MLKRSLIRAGYSAYLATVVMPKFAPLIKVSTCQQLGATVILHGDGFGEAKARAHELATENGLAYIDGYDDPAIISGQGTMGLEVVEQIPDLEAVIVPVGGAGLLAGVALAVKTLRPRVKIITVEAENVASFSAALEAGKPAKIKMHPTLADGLAIPQVGTNAFQIARPLVDLTVTVIEEEIALAILRLVELEKSVVEGAAATPPGGVHVRKVTRTHRQAGGAVALRWEHRSQCSKPRNRTRTGRGRTTGPIHGGD